MAILTEAITEICKTSLQYESEFMVEGLLGITLDQEEVMLVNINELVKKSETNQVLSFLHFSLPTQVVPENKKIYSNLHSTKF